MDELIAFINARLDEDQAALAEDQTDNGLRFMDTDSITSKYVDTFADNDRVRREIEAKRAIVRDYLDCAVAHSKGHGYPEVMRAARDAHGRDLLHLAAVWSDHPDYQSAWAP